MMRSLLVILVPLVLLVLFFSRPPSNRGVHVVDWQPVLGQARAQAPYPVLAPPAVPTGWRATTVSWVQRGNPGLNGTPSPGNAWQLGFLDASNIYISVHQQDAAVDTLVGEVTRKGVADGQSTVAGQPWQRMVSSDGRTHSLVQRTGTVTSIVSGDLPYASLDSFTQTLTAS